MYGHPPGDVRLVPIPDPLNDAEDAEALETWLLSRRYQTCTIHDPEDGTLFEVRGNYRPASVVRIHPDDEPDPARRRRRALVEAAWQAVRATASAAEEAEEA